jgi:hypothetical protein
MSVGNDIGGNGASDSSRKRSSALATCPPAAHNITKTTLTNRFRMTAPFRGSERRISIDPSPLKF